MVISAAIVYLFRSLIGVQNAFLLLPLLYIGFSVFAYVHVNRIEKSIADRKAELEPVPKNELEKYGISRREQQVIELIFLGYSNKKISTELYVSLNTVKTHVKNIFSKIGVSSRMELVTQLRNHSK